MKRIILLLAMVTSLLSLGAVVAAFGDGDGDGEPGALCCDQSKGQCSGAFPLCFNSGIDCDPAIRSGIQGYCVKDNDAQ